MVMEDILQTTYTTPEEVAEAMGLPAGKGGDTYGFWTPSDTTVPSYDQICRMIRANEDVIDRRMMRSWRENYVKDEIRTINTYQHDLNAWRGEYYRRGGNYVQLHRDIRPWDPRKGDRLEIRVRGNSWRDVTFAPETGQPEDVHDDRAQRGRYSFWWDYKQGRLFLRTSGFQTPYNAVRVSYRWGFEGEVPPSISRLCALMTASQVINMSVFAIHVGSGGDIAGVRQDLQRMWQEEMNSIWSSWQRPGSVHSLLG